MHLQLDHLSSADAILSPAGDARSAILAGLRGLLAPSAAADLIDAAVDLYRLRRGRPQAFVAHLSRFREAAEAAGVRPLLLPAVERVVLRPW